MSSLLSIIFVDDIFEGFEKLGMKVHGINEVIPGGLFANDTVAYTGELARKGTYNLSVTCCPSGPRIGDLNSELTARSAR